MAGFPEPRDTNNPNLSLPASLELNTSSKTKHVSFSDTLIKHRYKLPRDPKPNPARIRCICCVWTCLGFVTLLLLALVVALASFALLRSALPQIRIAKLSFPKLQAGDAPGQKFLNADTSLSIEFHNMNDRIGLQFGSLTVDISQEHVKLGQTKVEGFFQRTANVTSLPVLIASVLVSKADVPTLGQPKSNFISSSAMVVDVFLRAKLIFYLDGLRMCGLPMEATCDNVKQGDVDGGRSCSCSVKLIMR